MTSSARLIVAWRLRVSRAQLALRPDAPSYFAAMGYPVGWWYEDFTAPPIAELEALLAAGKAGDVDSAHRDAALRPG